MTARPMTNIKGVDDLMNQVNSKEKGNDKQKQEIEDGHLQNAASTAENNLPSDTSAAEVPTSTNNEEQTTKVQNDNTVEQMNELKALKEKIKNYKKEPPKEAVTFFLTAENSKRVKAIKGRGMKSKLVNELLDLYFSEE